ncbi:hypothetical protein PLESTB_000854900 [Pleodorina starrii]|uniref:Uncharacterized protein n=1 Tax=Pleodorina starrii TaxID=330485 RepID=A0A9W6BLL4_9CHLO|nr:hypothetical protein PLESTM_001438900 [Pleodorina starrii]GLC54354.1 hypothetical protein PLESTB_000854900 [Pleodorina starrii]GLC72004.1 hypothetical protein PLESTF_001194100 [Pleodorina starrii]
MTAASQRGSYGRWAAHPCVSGAGAAGAPLCGCGRGRGHLGVRAGVGVAAVGGETVWRNGRGGRGGRLVGPPKPPPPPGVSVTGACVWAPYRVRRRAAALELM